MKKILLLTLLFVYILKTEAQILTDECFDKMIVQDITYAIFGESSPVTGIKIDISKPEATISGFFQPKRNSSWLLGFDFTGGLTNKNFSLFKGKKTLNSSFEIKPSVHFIPNWSDGNYDNTRKKYATKKRSEIVEFDGMLIDKHINNQSDSFYMIAILYNHHIDNIKSIGTVNISDQTASLPITAVIDSNTDLKDILLYFISELSHIPSYDNSNTLVEILSEVPQANYDTIAGVNIIDAKTINDKIYSEYKKYKKIYQNKKDNLKDMQIKNAEDAWVSKTYMWWTFAPFFKSEKVNKYYRMYIDENNDTVYTQFKGDYLLSGGGTVFFNYYNLRPQKVANYFKLGTNLSYKNNLNSLSSFNYEKKDSLNQSATQIVQTGTAYADSLLRCNFSGDLFAEYYFLPLNTFIPGFYVSTNLNFNKNNKSTVYTYTGNDILQVAFEGGLIFNINSREKDKEKSILSLSAYVRFEDLTDKRRTSSNDSKLESKDDYLERNLSYGLKVGIPITLPQRK